MKEANETKDKQKSKEIEVDEANELHEPSKFSRSDYLFMPIV